MNPPNTRGQYISVDNRDLAAAHLTAVNGTRPRSRHSRRQKPDKDTNLTSVFSVKLWRSRSVPSKRIRTHLSHSLPLCTCGLRSALTTTSCLQRQPSANASCCLGMMRSDIPWDVTLMDRADPPHIRHKLFLEVRLRHKPHLSFEPSLSVGFLLFS